MAASDYLRSLNQFRGKKISLRNFFYNKQYKFELSNFYSGTFDPINLISAQELITSINQIDLRTYHSLIGLFSKAPQGQINAGIHRLTQRLLILIIYAMIGT